MTDQEQIIKWQAEFVNEFKINPFHMGRDYLLKMSDLNPTEFDEQTIQAKWLWYLAARKAAQVEFNSWVNLNITINQQHTAEREQLKKQLEDEFKGAQKSISCLNIMLAKRMDEIVKLKALLSQAKPYLFECQHEFKYRHNEDLGKLVKETNEVLG